MKRAKDGWKVNGTLHRRVFDFGEGLQLEIFFDERSARWTEADLLARINAGAVTCALALRPEQAKKLGAALMGAGRRRARLRLERYSGVNDGR